LEYPQIEKRARHSDNWRMLDDDARVLRTATNPTLWLLLLGLTAAASPRTSTSTQLHQSRLSVSWIASVTKAVTLKRTTADLVGRHKDVMRTVGTDLASVARALVRAPQMHGTHGVIGTHGAIGTRGAIGTAMQKVAASQDPPLGVDLEVQTAANSNHHRSFSLRCHNLPVARKKSSLL